MMKILPVASLEHTPITDKKITCLSSSECTLSSAGHSPLFAEPLQSWVFGFVPMKRNGPQGI